MSPVEMLSSYAVLSERTYRDPAGEPMRVLYSTRTGSAGCVPAAVADRLLTGRLHEVDEQTLAALRSIEALVDVGEDERTTVLDRQRSACADLSEPRFVLLPSRYCNMGCEYCGQEHVRGGVGPDHRAAVAARVLAAIEAPATTAVKIRWFGAEPMLGYPTIRGLSEAFIRSAEENGVGYHARMVTNGTLLTGERLRVLLDECRVVEYDITLDGPPRVHDRHRPLKQGGRSFDRIVATVRAALDDPALHEVVFTLRTNIDVLNSEWVDEYIDLMAEHGFADDRVNFNLAPVYPWGNDVSAREIPRREYALREVAWMERMRRHGLQFVALPFEPVTQLCAAVTRSAEIISSTGAVFSCSEHPLVPRHEATGGLGRVGELVPAQRRPVGPFDDWHDAIAAGETPCHGCPIMPVCGGACPKQWREGNVPCPPMKFTLQERLDLVARMNGLTAGGEPAGGRG